MPMLTSPYGAAAAAKLNCLSPPLPTLGPTPSSRKSFHPWKKMADGHYPFAAYAPHYPMTSSLAAGSRDMTSSERGIGDGSGGGFAVHGYSHRGVGTGIGLSSSSSSCAMAPACVLPPGAGAAAAVPTGASLPGLVSPPCRRHAPYA